MSADRTFEAMADSIIEGEAEEAKELASKALAEGIKPLDAIDKGFVVGINEVGRAFACQEKFLPDLVRAGESLKAALGVLQPAMVREGSERPPAGRVVIGTVKGDIHEIGKNLVGTMLIANGFEVHDLGVDVTAEAFVTKAKEVNANLIGASALLTTTMPGQQEIVRRLQEADLHSRIKVIIGGAPVTRDWMKEIGADGFSEDALGAVQVATDILGAK
jgi:corrinoid protein of di/trimethylamine methyltransferase